MASLNGDWTKRTTPFKRRTLYGLQKMLVWTGIAGLYSRSRGRRGAAILMYHSVASSDSPTGIDPANAISVKAFREQMEFLRRRRRVLSMTELVSIVEADEDPGPNAIAVTFDDGYRDFLTLAAPILEENRIPATVYLATEFVSAKRPMWIDVLYSTFGGATRSRVEVEGVLDREYDIAIPPQRAAAYEKLRLHIAAATTSERDRVMGIVEEQLRPDRELPRLLLDWDEVRSLQQTGRFEFGGHTADHLDLSSHDDEVGRDQIARCFNDLARELDRSPLHFAFPYGRFSTRAVDAVRETGFRSAVCSDGAGRVGADSDPYQLPRIDPPECHSLFRFRTSGAYPDLSKSLFNRV